MSTLQPSERMAIATQRSRAVTERLKTLARVNRFASANGVRVGARARAQRRRLDAVIWLVALVLPTTVAGIYYGLILAPLYVTPFEFSVRGAEIVSVPDKDGLAKLSALETGQNTMIVVDYLNGRALIEDLEKRIPLRQIYSNPAADRFSRLDPAEPVEELQRYMKGFIKSSISSSSFAIHVTARAFTPDDSLKVALAIQASCEAMINKLSERARETAMKEAKVQLDAAEAQLTAINAQMRDLRNEQGVVDANATVKQKLALLLAIEKQRVEVDVQLRSLEGQLSADSPTVRRLREQLTQIDRSVEEQKRSLASVGQDASVLANKMQLFEGMEVRRKAAEKSYIELLKSFQIARIMAERQQVYLNTIVSPMEPQSAQEPRRMFWFGVTFVSSLAVTFLLMAGKKFVI